MVNLHTPYIYSQGKRGMAGAVGVWVLRKAIPRGIMDKKRIGRRQEICMRSEGETDIRSKFRNCKVSIYQ